MSAGPKLGIRANFGQFALLVLTNGFVGAMLGVERSVMPELPKKTSVSPPKQRRLRFSSASD